MSDAGTLCLRYMQVTDVPAVLAIEQASFTPSWGEHSFRFEINESRVSYMVVLTHGDTPPTPISSLRRWWERLRRPPESAARETVLAFGGLWNIEDEGHISTIATDPQQRGRSYGEIVLAAMVMRAMSLGARFIVLEVRVSNTVAQNLYHKYGFSIASTKHGYYQNDKEDAYDMRLMLDTDAARQHVTQLYAALQQRIPFIDAYTQTRHPRLGR